jgi:hypothetical protein
VIHVIFGSGIDILDVERVEKLVARGRPTLDPSLPLMKFCFVKLEQEAWETTPQDLLPTKQ